MSLIHDALKKAEKDQESLSSDTQLVDTGEEKKTSITRVFLLTLLVFAVLLSVGVKFFKKVKFPKFANVSSQVQVATPQPQVTLPPTPPVASGSSQLLDEATSLVAAKKYEEAKEKWEKVVIHDPRNADAYNNLGFVLKKLGQNDEAFDQYRKALAINPECAECLNNLGSLYLATRDFAEAEKNFQKAITSKPDYADPYFHTAILQEARGDVSGAKKNYQRYLELVKDIEPEMMIKIQKRISSLDKSN